MKNVFLIVVFSILAACQPHKPTPQDTIVIGIEKNPESFDPRLPKDAISQKINKLIYSGLMQKDDQMNYVPDIAANYTIENPLTYIFFLRDNVYFHNQKKLTSTDVKSTYLSLIGDEINSPYKDKLSIIATIETPDTRTIVFKLKQPYSPFLSLMALGVLPSPDKSAGLQPIGTGPYRLVPDKSSDNLVVLARFDRYYQQAAKTRELHFRVIEDSTLRALELMNGRIDLVQNNIPYIMIPYLKEKPALKFFTATGINFSYMAFHFKNRYLENKNVRRAIALAIDREKIIRYKLASMAEPATSLLSPRHWLHHRGLIPYQYDIALAKQLLNQTPFPDPDGDGPIYRFNLEYKTSSVKERIEIAQLIAEDLKKVGINVTVKPYEFGTFYRDIRQGDFDLFTLTWVGLSDAEIYHEVFHSQKTPPAGANRGYYSNRTLDELLKKTQTELDATRLKGLYEEIQQIVYDDFVYAPLWYETNFVFMNKRIQGYSLRPDASFANLVNAYKQDIP